MSARKNLTTRHQDVFGASLARNSNSIFIFSSCCQHNTVCCRPFHCFWNSFATSLFQAYYNLCVFTCVAMRLGSAIVSFLIPKKYYVRILKAHSHFHSMSEGLL